MGGLRESVAHDGYKHVQEYDHDQESRQEEQDIAHRALATAFHVSISIELAQAELIHILKGVKGPERADIRYQATVFSVQINDVEGCAKGHVPDDHDDHEVLNAKDCVDHQTDEEGRIVKEA